MTYLICGSRTWTDRHAIWRELAVLPPDTTIIHGGAHGADRIAGQEARRLGLVVIEYPADWGQHGRAAGVIRNKQMLVHGKPDRVIAFSQIPVTKGTADMVDRARKAGIPTTVLSE